MVQNLRILRIRNTDTKRLDRRFSRYLGMKTPEPVFSNLLSSPGIDSQPGGMTRLHKCFQIRAQRSLTWRGRLWDGTEGRELGTLELGAHGCECIGSVCCSASSTDHSILKTIRFITVAYPWNFVTDPDADPVIFNMPTKFFFAYDRYFLRVQYSILDSEPDPIHFLVTNGTRCGSGGPTNIWILRIRIRNTGFDDSLEVWLFPISLKLLVELPNRTVASKNDRIKKWDRRIDGKR